MLQKIKALSLKRWPWALLSLSALLLLGIALYFQYEMNLQPCIKCIYIRAAFAGIAVAGLAGFLFAGIPFLRLLAVAGWLAASVIGISQAADLLAIEQLMQDGGFFSCALFAEFPHWMPLDKWLPSVFEPTGSCGDTSWQFLDKSMSFWSWAILWGYAVIAALILLSQPVRISKNPYR
ncbi:disulfide bond formation protein DsbB [Chromatiaceae bacterium AAb-1]|nr:disulfide bond formation protein DsbB [Chromatiaceae bacterium AAb-1]